LQSGWFPLLIGGKEVKMKCHPIWLKNKSFSVYDRPPCTRFPR
jgi:hypothetical protein